MNHATPDDLKALCEEVFGFAFPAACAITPEMIEILYQRYRKREGSLHPALWNKLLSDVFTYTPECPCKSNALTAAINRLGSSHRRILYVGDLISCKPKDVESMMGAKSFEAIKWFMEKYSLSFGTDVRGWSSDTLRARL